jgi:hypothetical protein
MIYRLFVDYDLLVALDNMPSDKRRRLKGHLGRIRHFPGNLSDHAHLDPDGRVLHVSLFENLAIFYWVDDADRHVKVMRIAQRA